jgi:hypothetical protein
VTTLGELLLSRLASDSVAGVRHAGTSSALRGFGRQVLHGDAGREGDAQQHHVRREDVVRLEALDT